MRNLVVLLMFFSISIYGQKCNYLANKVSGMDGKRLVITEPLTLVSKYGEGSVDVWSTIYGDTSLMIAFVIRSKQELALIKGDSINITLDTGDQIILNVMQDAVSKETDQTYSLTALTRIDDLLIEKFQNQIIEKVAIDYGDSITEGSPQNKKQAVAIRNIVNCVVEYLVK